MVIDEETARARTPARWATRRKYLRAGVGVVQASARLGDTEGETLGFWRRRATIWGRAANWRR